MFLQPITLLFITGTLKPSVYTLIDKNLLDHNKAFDNKT